MFLSQKQSDKAKVFDFHNIIDITQPTATLSFPLESTMCSYNGISNQFDPADLENGTTIDDLETQRELASLKLGPHVGLCMVFDADSENEAELNAQHLMKAVKPWLETLFNEGEIDPPLPERVLFRNRRKDSHIGLSADAVLYLVSKGIKLVGIEADQISSSKDSAIELLLNEHNVVYLTKLNLSNPKSLYPYFLTAAPLLLDRQGCSPTRATLVALKEN
jgi:kynurenine formamidase